jgi:hypothetical protein
MSIEYRGKTDSKIQPIMDIASKATDTFVNAIADMKEFMAFRAFTVGNGLTPEQKNGVLDILMTQFAIRLKEVAPELMHEKTITCCTEETEEGLTVWFKATNEVPPPVESETPYRSFDPVENEAIPEPKIELLTNEEYEKRKDELLAEIAKVKAEAAADSVLLEASGIGHVEAEEHVA